MQLGILGLSKSGKTTLFNTLTASQQATGKFAASFAGDVAPKDFDRRVDVPQRAEDRCLLTCADEIRMATRQPGPRRAPAKMADQPIAERGVL